MLLIFYYLCPLKRIMKMKKAILITTCLLAAFLRISAQEEMYVGGDISTLQSYEDNNVNYLDQQGQKIDDVLKYMKSSKVGWNAQRVRLFVNPQQKGTQGEKDAQVCQDLDYVLRLARRIKDEGFALMLDFHYSDTWADPSNQWTPAAWVSMNDEQLQQQVYDYTKSCLERLVEAGATPDFIQTGNEISYGMLWGKQGTTNPKICYQNSPTANWTRFVKLLEQATKACREVCPQAKIVIHTERSGDASALTFILDKLSTIDYDVIGLSYYPFWHGPLTKLSQTLNELAQRYADKKVQVVETAYYYQWQPTKDITDFSKTWAVSPDGQAAFAHDLIEELKKHPNVNGLYWWFPEENGNGPGSKVLTNWVNRGLWNNDTHRAHPGLYVLKEFLGTGTGIANVTVHNTEYWYSLQGTRLDTKPQRRGLYIHKGQKYIIR